MNRLSLSFISLWQSCAKPVSFFQPLLTKLWYIQQSSPPRTLHQPPFIISVLPALQKQTQLFPVTFALDFLAVSVLWPDHFPSHPVFYFVLQHSHALNSHLQDVTQLPECCTGISSTYLSFPWCLSTETSCFFSPPPFPMHREHWPYALSHKASFLPQVSSSRCTILIALLYPCKVSQKSLNNVEVFMS